MKVYDAAHIKNIAIVGHGGDGKTTLAEASLLSGILQLPGRSAARNRRHQGYDEK